MDREELRSILATLDANQYLSTATRIRGAELFVRLFGESGQSRLLPTRRWGEPHYVLFCYRSVALPSRQHLQPTPHSWGAFEVSTERLKCFSDMSLISFADQRVEETEVDADDDSARTRNELRAIRADVDRLMDILVPIYIAANWTEENGTQSDRSALLLALRRSVTNHFFAWEQQLAPDFFAWLKAA